MQHWGRGPGPGHVRQRTWQGGLELLARFPTVRGMPCAWHVVCVSELRGTPMDEEDRTEVIQTNTTPTTREVVTPAAPRRTEVYTTDRPRATVDRTDSVAYDPYASRRLAAYR